MDIDNQENNFVDDVSITVHAPVDQVHLLLFDHSNYPDLVYPLHNPHFLLNSSLFKPMVTSMWILLRMYHQQGYMVISMWTASSITM